MPYFSARLDFLLPPLSAPGSPRMFNGLSRRRQVTKTVFLSAVQNMSHFSMYVFKQSFISCQLCQYLGQYLAIACCISSRILAVFSCPDAQSICQLMYMYVYRRKRLHYFTGRK